MGIVCSTFKRSHATHTSPPSPFELLLNAALHDYAKQTGKKLEHHPLTKKLKKCDSVDSVTSVLQDYQEHAKAFRKFRGDHGKIMRPMKRAVYVLFTLSSNTFLGEVVALVCPKSFISTSSPLTRIPQPLPPAKAVFAAFGILLGVGLSSFKRIYPCDTGVYQAVKDVNASYDALVELFESVERFLGRLEIYTKITLSEAMKDIVVKIIVEVISTLALATKQVKQGPLSKSCPRCCYSLT